MSDLLGFRLHWPWKRDKKPKKSAGSTDNISYIRMQVKKGYLFPRPGWTITYSEGVKVVTDTPPAQGGAGDE